MKKLRNYLRRWLGVHEPRHYAPPPAAPVSPTMQQLLDAQWDAVKASNHAAAVADMAMREAQRTQDKIDALCLALGIELAVTDEQVRVQGLKPDHHRHVDAYLIAAKMVEMQHRNLKQMIQLLGNRK